mmetsp:Transcript_2964/g.6031  ORF Transcript_2964/g.6031 Transcript_2964/m.6031 type:complete len:255 (+) Transcript_2964:764-1528(+)
MLSRACLSPPNLFITLAETFRIPPLPIVVPTLALTLASQGSMAPFALGWTPAESKRVESFLTCPPHIHKTLSPLTEGTEICAPTPAPFPTHISLAEKWGSTLSISDLSSSTFEGVMNSSMTAKLVVFSFFPTFSAFDATSFFMFLFSLPLKERRRIEDRDPPLVPPATVGLFSSVSSSSRVTAGSQDAELKSFSSSSPSLLKTGAWAWVDRFSTFLLPSGREDDVLAAAWSCPCLTRAFVFSKFFSNTASTFLI